MRKRWVLGLVVVAVSCSGGSSGGSTSRPPPTTSTAPPITPSTSATSTTTTEPVVATECTESLGTSAPFEFPDETALDSFGPLRTTPSLQVRLNLDLSSAAVALPDWNVGVARIPGGLLLSATPLAGGRSLLTAIDADGERRWTRCFDDGFSMYVAPASAVTPTVALLLFYVPQFDLGTVAPDWRVIDLTSGATVGALTAVLAEQGVDMVGIDGWTLASSETGLLFGPAQDEPIDTANDHMVHVDLATLFAASLPFPSELDGRQLFDVTFGFTSDGDVAVTEYDHGLQTPTMVYTDGEWRGGAAATASLPAVRAGDVFDADGVNWLVGVDPTGTEVWRVTEILLPNDEGFRHAQSGNTTVMSGCTSLVNFVCERTMAGIDTVTGQILWTNPDYGGVLALGDGYALITSSAQPGAATTRMMIDTSTGAVIDPLQTWSPNAYYQSCCGDETHWIQRVGGVVFVRVDGVLDVWYPADVDLPTREVSVP